MAYSALEALLGYVTLTESIEQQTNGIPEVLPEPFMRVTDKVIKDQGQYVRRYGQRRTPKLNAYGSPSHKSELKKVDQRPFKCAHFFDNVSLDPHIFSYLRSYTKYEVDRGLQMLKDQVNYFATRFQNMRVASVLRVISEGDIHFDSDGELLPSSSGADFSMDFGVNANNQNQLNGIISDSWALQDTDIPLQLRLLKQRARRLTGLPLKYAIYGENVPSYLTLNDYVLDYLARSGKRDEYLDNEGGELPNGLFGLTWIPAYEAFYEDKDGTNQSLWGADKVVFTPEPSQEWWGVAEGSYEVPKTLNLSSTAEAAYANLETVYGRFGYAVPTHDPVGICQYYGDTFLPLLKNPDALYMADVTP